MFSLVLLLAFAAPPQSTLPPRPRVPAPPKTAACDCRPVCDCDGCQCKGRPTPAITPKAPEVKAANSGYTFATGHPQPGYSYVVRAGVAVPITRSNYSAIPNGSISSCPGGVCPLPKR